MALAVAGGVDVGVGMVTGSWLTVGCGALLVVLGAILVVQNR